MVEIKSIATEGARGFIEGIGLDSLVGNLGYKFPALWQESPVPAPPGYLSAKLHWDDLIVLGIGAALAVFGAVKRDMPRMAEGIGIAAGSYLWSTQILPRLRA